MCIRDRDGTEKEVKPDEKTKQIIYTISNKKEDTEIYFRKKAESNNDDGKPQYLEDAEFELLYKANDQSKSTNVKDADGNNLVVKSDTNGIFKFTNLKNGTYQVKETKAPTGYIKRTEPVYTFKVKDNKIYNNDDTEIEDNSEDKPIDIENKKATFPLTGGNGVFTGLSLIHI